MVAPGTGPGRDPVAVRPPLHVRRGPPTSPCRSSSPGRSRTSRPAPSGRPCCPPCPKTTPVFANLVNGGHIDSTDPQIISRWLEFLDLYVADKVPTQPNGLAALVLDEFTSFASGTSAQAPLPAIRFTTATRPWPRPARTSPSQTPRVEMLFDNGAGASGAGDPQSTYSRRRRPVAAGRAGPKRGSSARTGRLTTTGTAQPKQGTANARLDPGARPATSLPSTGNAWAADSGVGLDARPGRRTAPASRPHPFTTATTIAGPATLDLWVASPHPGRRPPGHRHRGATGRRAGGVRDVRLPAQLVPGRPAVDHATCHHADSTCGPTHDGCRHELHPGEDPHRPHRAHLPARHRAPGRDLRHPEATARRGSSPPSTTGTRRCRSATAAPRPRAWRST